MDVILLERIEKLGAMGDVVSVKPGYARNFLLPQAKALRATKANKIRFEAEREFLEARNAENREKAAQSGESIDGETYIVIRNAGDTGQLYGSVSARDIAETVGDPVKRTMVNLNDPIKALGLHEVAIRMHPEVTVTITINVARTEDEAERQAKGEDVIAMQMDADKAEAEEAAAERAEIAAEMFDDGGEAIMADNAPAAEAEEAPAAETAE